MTPLDDVGRGLRQLRDRIAVDEGFRNARFARTLFEQALNVQAVRLADDGERLRELAPPELMALHAPDLAAARALGEDEAPKGRRWGRGGR